MKQTIRLIASALLSVTATAAEPIVIADFEGADYGRWKASGEAFGTGPAHGKIGSQQDVDGFLGRGLVNSFQGGDDATGRLTSPPFRIERKFLTFLIGGGGWSNETCMNLIVDGKVVRSATGPNTDSGGSERLTPVAWEVGEFLGREATLIMVDERKGGWGHINLDHIVLTDDRGTIALALPPATEVTRKLRVEADFLQLPQMRRTGNHRREIERFTIEDGGKVLRVMHLKFPAKDQQPDFLYSVDMREFRGREVTLRSRSTDAGVLDRLELNGKEVIDPKAYAGPNRPRFHFSPRIGWMNDVNGSYYQDGLYHLFYQANPTTAASSTGFDMHWGHSVSKDLVHWEEWPIALFPTGVGQCYSGTALLIDRALPGVNEKAPLPTPALFFSGTTPFSQHLATSADGGRTWQRHGGNPVVPNIGGGDRDPKVIWHAASQHYVMFLYVDHKGYVILRSKNLTQWEQVGALANWFECPEFIPMKSPVTGEDLWMLYGCYRSPKDAKEPFVSDSAYQLGRFDGKTFTPVSKLRSAHQGPNFYAALTFVNEPKGRPVMMGWARDTTFPNEPFNQCASLPLLLTLKAFNNEATLCFEPAEELNSLRGKPLLKLNGITIAEAQSQLQLLAKDASLDVTVRLRTTQTAPIHVSIRETGFVLEPTTGKLSLTKAGKPVSNTQVHYQETVMARFLIDRGIIESFWNGGEAAYSIASLHTASGPAFDLSGDAIIEELVVYPMADIWK
ncbi:MAG: glycoside hydrolase family 32 protein [Verrucomicrobiota bacterium]